MWYEQDHPIIFEDFIPYTSFPIHSTENSVLLDKVASIY